jgi:hypothetical protein
MRKVSMRHAVTGLALFMSANSAAAHGIAGNRYFVGALTMDDPSVADEAIVPNFSNLNEPGPGGNTFSSRIDWSFARLLTSVLQVQINSGWLQRTWPTARSFGLETTEVGIKSELYRDNQHELLVSAGVVWASGNRGRKPSARIRPTRSSPACSWVRALAIYLTASRGRNHSPSQVPSWPSCRWERR